MTRMTGALNVYEAFRSIRASTGGWAKWARDNPGQRAIVEAVLIMRDVDG